MKIRNNWIKFGLYLMAFNFVISAFSGCKPNNNPSPGKSDSIPAEQTQAYIDANNRTSNVNGAFICEDEKYFYYKNYADSCALYKLDKKTGGKFKLTDAFDSGEKMDRPKIMQIVGTTDDKVYFLNADPEPNATASFKTIHIALYSVDKDGKNREKLVTDVFACIIKNGYAYYDARDVANNENTYRIDLETKKSELFINGSTGYNIINDAGDKMYYTRTDRSTNIESMYEFDMNSKIEKMILTSSDLGSNKIDNVMYLNYFKNTLYFTEYKSIRKYDIINNVLETISVLPNGKSGTYDSLAVSNLGIFYFVGSTLYNLEGPVATEILTISGYGSRRSVGLAGNYIIVTNTLQGDSKTFTNDFVKAYTLKGLEVNLGF